MAEKSEIEWCDATWQVASGCNPISEGCRHCYSARLAGTRLRHLARTEWLTTRTDMPDLTQRAHPALDWVIVGGESGPGARDNDFITNARSLLAQCQAAGVPFFGKQNVGKKPLPNDLMDRQIPEARHG